jgi:hypothetical protein
LKYMSNKMKISLKTMPKATLVKSGVVNTAYTSCNHSWLFYLTWTTWTSGPEGWYRWLASAKARTECSEVLLVIGNMNSSMISCDCSGKCNKGINGKSEGQFTRKKSTGLSDFQKSGEFFVGLSDFCADNKTILSHEK